MGLLRHLQHPYQQHPIVRVFDMGGSGRRRYRTVYFWCGSAGGKLCCGLLLYSETPMGSRSIHSSFTEPAMDAHKHLLLEKSVGEFQSEVQTVDGQTAKARLQTLPRDMRLALFAAVSWGVCVPSYVFLFKPYGRYMRDDDTLHMIGVIFIPIIIGLGLFSIYRKFIR